jgi:UDP-N-acetylglucosamine diphosphorylase / glucose-1-phosphate thymidylyltransferase / UDP-N-acetylgalactosamine diphosphorylase / glucosamine-1-phosphate N-acetyltransferase / galactosamine-1-phosphate N-acetyltransferase
MNRLLLEDAATVDSLYPFIRTRHTADIRVGILTIREKWERLTGLPVLLQRHGNTPPAEGDLVIPAHIIPTRELAQQVLETGLPADFPANIRLLEHPWQIFGFNDEAIRDDFQLLKRDKVNQPVPESVQVVQWSSIFIEEGARLTHCILNASAGPIYIGRDAEIMEGSLIRGPFALCEGAVVKMGSRIYGATTIGPYCVVGGEVKNSVLFGYSNKAHDGYLGDSVLGEWCNLGAGTSNSNIKNTAGEVKVWSGAARAFAGAGQKCGLIMGDYSRAAINTSFNTGTVVGVCCNVFGQGLTPKYIPDFTWGDHTLPRYEFGKAMQDIANWKKLKNQTLAEEEIQKLKTIFDAL